MNVLILNGSARGQKGVTGRLLKGFVEGLIEGNAEVAEFNLAGLNISPCTACLSCMHKVLGECAVKDDMEEIYRAMKRSDMMVLATPVYTDTMSAQMKNVMDRSICSMQGFLTKDRFGRVRHLYSWRMPAKFMLMATSGFPEVETFEPLIATYRAQALNFGSEAVAEICVPGSIAIQMEPERLNRHLGLIKEAGKEIALEGSIRPDVLSEINIPPLTVDEYFIAAAKYESWLRKKLGETGQK
ncbi:MAG: iron-sulfur flavoprotein [Deltaproteobacteria bacterium]|nr:iron-sulfur flavoprotein [Deltaproteobacteria bacterium]